MADGVMQILFTRVCWPRIKKSLQFRFSIPSPIRFIRHGITLSSLRLRGMRCRLTFFHAMEIIRAVQRKTWRNCGPAKPINYAGMDRRRAFFLFFYDRNSLAAFSISFSRSFTFPSPSLAHSSRLPSSPIFCFLFLNRPFLSDLTNGFRIPFYISAPVSSRLSYPFWGFLSFFPPSVRNQLPLLGKHVNWWNRIVRLRPRRRRNFCLRENMSRRA